jgi:hypothetical protein
MKFLKSDRSPRYLGREAIAHFHGAPAVRRCSGSFREVEMSAAKLVFGVLCVFLLAPVAILAAGAYLAQILGY